MRLVLDSSVAGYLVGVDAPAEQQARADLAIRLTKSEHDLLLPTPVLAEILALVDKSRHDATLAQLSAFARFVDFDVEAARIAARGLPRRAGARARPLVKVDIQIVACAMRWGARGLCVEDADHDRVVRDLGADLTIGPPSRFLPNSLF